MQERRGVWGCVCVFYSPPPLVFVAGSHGVKLAEPPSAASEEMTRGEVEVVGPMGQVGRPSRTVGLPGLPIAPIFFQRAVLDLLLSECWGLPCLDMFWRGFLHHFWST